MAFGTQGIDLPYQSTNAGVIPGSVFWLGINYYANRCPLLANLDKAPLGAMSFIMNNDNYRPRASTLGAGYTLAATSVTVADGTQFTVGDVIQIESEYMLVTAVNTATNVLTVSIGYGGTTNAAHTNGLAVALVTNARTGGDIDQLAMNRIPSVKTQYAQTIQHAYQVGGSQQSATNYLGGAVTPVARSKMLGLQHVMDDWESAMYTGKAQAGTSTILNPAMAGVTGILTTNVTTSPTNASAYKPSDFVRDTLAKCYAAGGNPDTMIVGTNFLIGLQTWGFIQQLIAPKATTLGISIQEYYVPFMNGVRIIPGPLMPAGAAFVFNSQEVRVRVKRDIQDYPRGRRGDAVEGDIIGEGALDVENEYHHAWLNGVTGFAVQT